jgi:hypothetical protein
MENNAQNASQVNGWYFLKQIPKLPYTIVFVCDIPDGRITFFVILPPHLSASHNSYNDVTNNSYYARIILHCNSRKIRYRFRSQPLAICAISYADGSEIFDFLSTRAHNKEGAVWGQQSITKEYV